jgi:MFS family permease
VELEPEPTPAANGNDAGISAAVGDAIASLPDNGRRGPFYAFRFRNFRLFFFGQIISVAGTWMQTVAQNWLVWQLTKSATWLGIVNGVSAIPVVLMLWGGHLADRYSRRAILVWTQTLAMILAFVLAALATNRWVPVQAWHVAVLAALSSIVNAFNMPAQQAFVTDIVDDRAALSNAIALNSLRFNIARFLGPILAGYVLVRASVAACFFINGLSFIAVILSLLRMRLPKHRPHHVRTSLWEGFRYIRDHRNVLRIVLLVASGAILSWPVSTLYPVFAASFHTGAKGYSALMSANGIGAALGGLMLAILGDRLPRRALVYGGATLFCIALLLLSVAPHYGVALAMLVISGFAMILFGISSNTRVQEEVPDALRGRVMAVYSLVFNGLFPVGCLLIGTLADPKRLGAPGAVRLNASLCLAITAGLWLWSRAERRHIARSLQPGEAQ